MLGGSCRLTIRSVQGVDGIPDRSVDSQSAKPRSSRSHCLFLLLVQTHSPIHRVANRHHSHAWRTVQPQAPRFTTLMDRPVHHPMAHGNYRPQGLASPVLPFELSSFPQYHHPSRRQGAFPSKFADILSPVTPQAVAVRSRILQTSQRTATCIWSSRRLSRTKSLPQLLLTAEGCYGPVKR